MRLIFEKPEFSLGGTTSILLGFTFFGLTQSIVVVARQRSKRRRTLTLVRGIGVIGVLPLFAGAGALMLPSVVGDGLAWARHDWRRSTRGICCLVAAIPVLFISHGLVDAFGASARTAGGVVGLLAVYAVII